jgi:cyclopropane fatty-acyl-phospholipid synthase-like methyltransferase
VKYLLVTSVLLLACTGHHPAAMHHSFANAEDWARRFDDPARDAWQKPDEVLALLKLSPEMKVGDIGAATGYFSVRASKLVPQGHVYGVDVESAMVDYLKARAEREELKNLTAVLAAPDDPKLPEPVDVVLLVDTWHHVDNRIVYFDKLRASVKPGGRLVVIDFTRESSMGPPASAKSTPDEVIAELKSAGWALQTRSALLPEQFLLIFTR